MIGFRKSGWNKVERRLHHHKQNSIGQSTGEVNPDDIREGETKIVKNSAGFLMGLYKFNGVIRQINFEEMEG